MEWISAYRELPDEEREIFFMADEDQTDERIGWACPEEQMVLLKRTEMKFKHLRWWFYIPHPPGSQRLK